jgi:hypothetical protein
MNQQAENLRRAIENLMNAKLHDALRPDGLGRLIANRTTGVASVDIRSAERQLDELLGKMLAPECSVSQSEIPASRRMN